MGRRDVIRLERARTKVSLIKRALRSKAYDVPELGITMDQAIESADRLDSWIDEAIWIMERELVTKKCPGSQAPDLQADGESAEGLPTRD